MPTRYIYPPRPKTKMHPRDLPLEESRGIWVAQYKFKGTRNLLHVTGGDVILYNRHGSRHKRFEMTNALRAEILSLNLDPAKDYVLDGELMDHFTKDLKGTIVLYDLLWAGRYLYGTDQMRRLTLLDEICRNPGTLEPQQRALQVTPHIWLAQTFLSDFATHWSWAAERPDLEGLVLRKKAAKIENMGNVEYSSNDIIRCRKPEIHSHF